MLIINNHNHLINSTKTGFDRDTVRRRRRRGGIPMDLENMFDIVSLSTEDSNSDDEFDSNSDGDEEEPDVEGNEEGGWETTSETED